MYLDEDCFHSSIACRSDSLEPQVVVKLVNVKPSTRMGDPTQYILQCSLANTDHEWSVERRYSEFRKLLKVLQAFFLRRGGGARPQCFGCAWFTQTLRSYWLPRRHLLCSRSTSVINQRRAELHQFVLILASHTFSAVPKCISCAKTIFPIMEKPVYSKLSEYQLQQKSREQQRVVRPPVPLEDGWRMDLVAADVVSCEA
ncbi:Phox homologous domain [Phytophthora cactorum]|nr:Phox homologous domain [Phytophthora cactorum]